MCIFSRFIKINKNSVKKEMIFCGIYKVPPKMLQNSSGGTVYVDLS